MPSPQQMADSHRQSRQGWKDWAQEKAMNLGWSTVGAGLGLAWPHVNRFLNHPHHGLWGQGGQWMPGGGQWMDQHGHLWQM